MRVIVVGTGTDIGKTHVTTCLLTWVRRQGQSLAAYKPIATGVNDTCEDAALHARALGAAYVHPTFAYRRPISPHLAAREEGRPIDLDAIVTRALAMEKSGGDVLIEGAGGLFTPVSETATSVDLIERLAPARVVLVAPDRLGVLHDVNACVTAARARGVAIAAIALSAPSRPDDSTGSNARELEQLGMGAVAGVFPRANADAGESQAIAARVWKLIRA